MNRKPLGKKLRFEVFKRDSFTCQYCGAKAPDVVLHVDHIVPLAEGGGDEPVNLTTACFGCNSGKGARRLSDDSVVSKQRAQLEELQAKREQIDMLLQWQRGLSDLKSMELDALAERVNEHLAVAGSHLNESGKKLLQRHLRKFGLSEMLEVVDIAFESYADVDEALRKLGGIAFNRQKAATDPLYDAKRKVAFAAAKVFRTWVPWRGNALIDEAVALGVSPDDLLQSVYEHREWSSWTALVERSLASIRREQAAQ